MSRFRGGPLLAKGPSLGRILAGLAFCAPLIWGGWVHWRGERSRETVAAMERSLEETRSEAKALRRTLAVMGPPTEAWRKAWEAGRFSPLDRRDLIQRPPALAENWRVTLETHEAPSPTRTAVAKGLEHVSQTVHLSGSAFLDGDALSFLDGLAWGGRLERMTLIRREGGISAADLTAIRAGEALAPVTFEATLSWDRWLWRADLGPRAEAPSAPLPVPPMEGIIMAPPEEVEAITAALRAGPWGRAPGWRDLKDLTLTGLVYAGPKAWMIWINGEAVEDQLPAPHITIERVDAEGVSLTVSLGPEDTAEIMLKPSWTYRVFENRLERTP
ncbi:MAG: hypothetical protein K9H25_11350 [Rhodospirillum sp.]|nr:hypothetical protein [Rhodospirillum sp.]MCF8489850.1 hypothetical protein [Rhodospirillum sp.]MCF8499413.1 hypothetical protein [Rhodospirillum sp.]